MCDPRNLKRLVAGLYGTVGETMPASLQPVHAIATPVPNRRRKLWELEDKHHCPVVGTCLALDELKKIARKAGFAGQDIDVYQLHVEAVSLSMSRNEAAEAMQKLMDRKFSLFVARFDKAKADAEVRALWDQHLDRGEVAGALWAAITHKAASPETRNAIYADVHMLSHQVGAGQAADLRRLEFLIQENSQIKQQARRDSERHSQELAEKSARIHWLENEVDQAGKRAEAASPLRARLEVLESGAAMIDMGRRLFVLEAEAARLREANNRLAAQASRVEALQMENERLVREWDEALAEGEALERVWNHSAAAKPDCAGECATCPGQLAGRCVLCVGGRTPLLPQYRQLAERLGVRLIHHDGGKEEALSRLPDMLAASDAVICPTDCVGHLAYYQLKRHCKAKGKPCVLVKSSGVASFAAALARLAEGRAEIQPQEIGE